MSHPMNLFMCHPPSKSTPFSVAVVLALLLLSTAVSLTAAVHVSEVLMTEATLFGGLDKDCTPNATTACEANVIDAVQWCRHFTSIGIPHAFLPTLDRDHILTKLHPLDWASNFRMHRRLKAARGVVSRITFPTDPTLATYSIEEEDPRLLDSFQFPTTHNMRDVATARFVDKKTRLHLVSARVRFGKLAEVAERAALTIKKSDAFRDRQGYSNTMVLVGERTAEQFAAAIAENGQKPEIICLVYASSDSVEFKNGTWLVTVKTSSTQLHRIQVHRESNTSSTIVNVTLTVQPLELPPTLRTDPRYLADRAMMKAEALIAAANNPVQGTTAGAMPAPTLPDGAAICRRRECAMGNLWADAIRNHTDTDVSLFSGAWLKGPGWAAGDVVLRDVYTSYGFIELAGKTTVLGLSLFELWNHSLAASAFDPYMNIFKTAARHLPQVSGMRVKYNLARADVNDRLISIEVWDRALKEYRPLERLKKYTVSGPLYLLTNSVVHSLYLKAQYAGEGPFTPVSQDVQDLLRQYLARTKGQYSPGIYGRIIEDNTSDVSMKEWNHRLAPCEVNFFLNTSLNSCVKCRDGTHRPLAEPQCIAVPVDEPISTTLVITVIAGAFIVLVIAGAAGIFGWSRWLRYKRTRYCPKDSAQPVGAFFVTVRNEVAVKERFPVTAPTAFKRIEDAVVQAANDHKCFVARRLGAHFLVVGSDPAATTRAAAQVQESLSELPWKDLLKPKDEGVCAGAEYCNVSPQATPNPARELTVSSRSPSQLASLQSSRSGPPTGTSPRSDNVNVIAQGATSLRVHEFVPLVSAGMAFGAVTINHDDELDTWYYTGPVVDAAATVADVARPGQFLTTEQLIEAAGVDESRSSSDLGATFEEVSMCNMCCPLMPDHTEVLLFQVDSCGCPRGHFEDLACGEGETAGALTAALETAAGGLTTRTVGAVCWSVPSLRSPKAFVSRAEQAKQLELVLAALTEVCKSFQADLTCAMDGTFVGVVNGSVARTAQVATTSTGMARAGVVEVQNVSDLRVVAGVATGAAMAGSLHSAVVVSGVAAERARLLATIANGQLDPGLAHAPSPHVSHAAGDAVFDAARIVIAGELFADVDPHYVLAAVDVVAWPDHCVTFQSLATREPVCLYAVVEEKRMAEDEWLYQLASASNPYAKTNAMLYRALAGEFDPLLHTDPSPIDTDPQEPRESEPAVPLHASTSVRGNSGNERRQPRVETNALLQAATLRFQRDLHRLLFQDPHAPNDPTMHDQASPDSETLQHRILHVVQAHTQHAAARFAQ